MIVISGERELHKGYCMASGSRGTLYDRLLKISAVFFISLRISSPPSLLPFHGTFVSVYVHEW